MQACAQEDAPGGDSGADPIRKLQTEAMEAGSAEWGYWGTNPSKYSTWTTHSNRLVPIYTFGIDLDSVTGERSVYRSSEALQRLYGQVPEGSLHPEADYCDQTDVYRLQRQAIEAGKKYIFLMVFDGMDWETTQAAATYQSGKLQYGEGRGTGLSFQDYKAPVGDYGYFVSSPHNDETSFNVDAQRVDRAMPATGGYDPLLGGDTPWSSPASRDYLIGKDRNRPNVYTDSAASATSMTAGIKTFNGAINVDPEGKQVETLAHWLQREKNFRVGAVSSVPISHATPAAAYAHNVTRNDYQDLSRDLLGLPSVAHQDAPLPGMDVVLGGGWGELRRQDGGQGSNYAPGNRYLADADLEAIDIGHGGRYVTAVRTPQRNGSELLREAAERAIEGNHRLFGFFGVDGGHLPFRTADGGYDPTKDVAGQDRYGEPDVVENPTLAQMTEQAIRVLAQGDEGFWLMVEPGDVDWANHANNLDNSIGAVLSGDEAFKVIVEWIDANQAWDESAVIVTADHGHYLNITDLSVLTSDSDVTESVGATTTGALNHVVRTGRNRSLQPDLAGDEVTRTFVSTQASSPNVVLIFMDDMGYADIGPFGATEYSTPNLDRMAREGRRFTDFVVSSAVCSASRAALLTGCYHRRVGISGALGPSAKIGINADEVTVAELCKSRGYATAMFGKWHLGHHPKFLPPSHGFDEYFGIPYSNDMWPLHPANLRRKEKDPNATGPWPRLPMLEGTEVINSDVQPEDQEQLTKQITQRSVEFIRRHADEPFFLYVPHPMVHVPLYASEEFQGKSGVGIFGDVMMEIDWSVGQILDAIEEIDARENTLVIFTSDNGPWLSYGDHAGSAGPLREGKGTMFEGGYREPTLMWWPGKIPAGTECDKLAGTIDVLPTVASIIGAELPAHKIDGVDIKTLLFGTAEASPRKHFYCYYAGGELQAVRNERFKLHFPHGYRTMNGRPGGTGGMPNAYSQGRIEQSLFDLDADVGETTDVQAQFPEVMEELLAVAEQARADLGDKLTKRPATGARPAGRLQPGEPELQW